MRRVLAIILSRMKLLLKSRGGIPRSLFVAILLSGLSYCAVGLCGCACLKETAKGFLGISTKDIENVRDKAIVKIVNLDYQTCYSKVHDRLTAIGSYIYAKDKDLIAVYISQEDTTPAGIFFKQIDNYKTQIEVVSPALDTKEFLAEKIFSIFQKQ